MCKKPTFGEKKQHIEYTIRPSSYAIIFNQDISKIAIIQKGVRYFLPGGGIENNETTSVDYLNSTKK